MSDDQLVELKVPTIGESISSAFIGRWLKKVGESVEAGDNIVELDSDKASLEVPSPVAGVVTRLLAEDGDEVPIGGVIAIIDTSGSPAAVVPSEASAGTPQVEAPKAGESTEPREATPSGKGPQS